MLFPRRTMRLGWPLATAKVRLTSEERVTFRPLPLNAAVGPRWGVTPYLTPWPEDSQILAETL